jgi:response regulator of citrate/malate metabolism
MRAFDVGIRDVLLKPVSMERLETVINSFYK